MKRKRIAGLGLSFVLAIGILPANGAGAASSSTAVQQGEKLAYQLSGFAKTIDNGDIYLVNSQYDGFSKQIQAAEKAISKVSGSSKRKGLNDKYVRPAKIARERLIYEVSQYRLMRTIGKDALANKVTYVSANLKKLDRLKKRAADIKKAGNYKAVPSKMTGFLAAMENQQKMSRFAVPDLKLNFVLTDAELDSFILMNQDRYFNGKNLLILSERLSYIADMKSQDVHKTGNFSQYTSSYGDLNAMMSKLGFSKYKYVGILLFKGSMSPKAQRDYWRGNSGMNRFIVDPSFEYAGSGQYNSYTTHLFADVQ